MSVWRSPKVRPDPGTLSIQCRSLPAQSAVAQRLLASSLYNELTVLLQNIMKVTHNYQPQGDAMNPRCELALQLSETRRRARR